MSSGFQNGNPHCVPKLIVKRPVAISQCVRQQNLCSALNDMNTRESNAIRINYCKFQLLLKKTIGFSMKVVENLSKLPAYVVAARRNEWT